MGQSEQFHETWAYLRDNAKPLRPDDVYDLREVRTFTAPSKGLRKRVERVRPFSSPIVPKPAPDTSERARINYALGFARRAGLGKK